MSNNHIVIEREKLERLSLNLLRLRDYIEDLENCLLLLSLPLDSSQHHNIVFLEFLMNLVTNELPLDYCQHFKTEIHSAHNLTKDCLGLKVEQL